MAVSVAVVLLVNGATEPGGDDTGLDWWKIGVGIAFLALAAKQWAKRPKRGETAPEPSWMATLDRAGPGLFHLLAGARAARPLEEIRRVLSDHNAAIMTVVLLLLGAKLLGDGLGGL